MTARTRLLLLNKPFGVLTQFTDRQGRPTLKDYVNVPDVYPAGRLDRDSEGLLLLTNDGRLQSRIADPRHRMSKTYWAQVEGEPSADQIAWLAARTTAEGRADPARRGAPDGGTCTVAP